METRWSFHPTFQTKLLELLDICFSTYCFNIFTADWSKIHWLKDMLVGNFNGQMWVSTANRLNVCVSSCHQVFGLENINTFVHFLKLFECCSMNYYLSNCQIKYMTKLLQSIRRCRLFTSAPSFSLPPPFAVLCFCLVCLFFGFGFEANIPPKLRVPI